MSTELEEIRAILRETAQRQQENAQAIAETRAITDSNARSIQANSSTSTENQRAIVNLATEVRQTFRDQSEDVVSMISDLANQQAFLTEQQSRLNQVATESFEAIREDRAETDRQIQTLVEESRVNAREHNAFRENIQRLFLEFQRIWQRLGGGNAA
ncbi:MAG: hypothetical protein F6K19_45980 [Cyanothece sp. SIO1E1]|nr:hypothetical protein [Cyanothece sp. SIO1E1]